MGRIDKEGLLAGGKKDDVALRESSHLAKTTYTGERR